NGESIVLHCKGGLGRTGTIAARLLVELGMTPGNAILAVREARPGAIETSAQETYVLACKPVPEDETALGRVLGVNGGVKIHHWGGVKIHHGRLGSLST
ncbi:MAG: hypothetical protein QF497_08015, partial [Verrucomicrobiota bacterium]|nr:hypothetical protein [Verrucomicrobiota bacterium]